MRKLDRAALKLEARRQGFDLYLDAVLAESGAGDLEHFLEQGPQVYDRKLLAASARREASQAAENLRDENLRDPIRKPDRFLSELPQASMVELGVAADLDDLLRKEPDRANRVFDFMSDARRKLAQSRHLGREMKLLLLVSDDFLSANPPQDIEQHAILDDFAV